VWLLTSAAGTRKFDLLNPSGIPDLSPRAMSEPSSKPSLFAETPPAPYPANDVLPEYSLAARSAPPRSVACSAEHRATLQTNGRTWLTLLLRSHTAHAGTQPYFLGSTPIKGAVELDLAKPECVQKITVQVQARL
jgi:hypothetical protein